MRRYQHFLLTRFNIPFNPFNIDKIQFLFDDIYLENRFNLFEKYCFSSVVNQTKQDFIWLVFFDIRTPDKFKIRNIELKKKHNNYCPIYIDFDYIIKDRETSNEYIEEVKRLNLIYNGNINYNEKDNFFKLYVVKFISDTIKKFSNGDEYIITTRLDNDDALHKRMVEFIQNIEINDDKLICLDNGLQFIENTSICQSYYYPNNHFTSYIEKNRGNLFTILFWEHYFISKVKKVSHYNTEPLWLEILHSSNAANSVQFDDKNKIKLRFSLLDFSINVSSNTFKSIASVMANPKQYLIPLLKYYIKRILPI